MTVLKVTASTLYPMILTVGAGAIILIGTGIIGVPEKIRGYINKTKLTKS